MNPDPIWPGAGGSAGPPELSGRWQALLQRAPRLRPWLDRMIGQRRQELQRSGAADAEVERALREDLSAWLGQLERLPEFAVSAIAVTLEDEGQHEVLGLDAEPAAPPAGSPEEALLEHEALLWDAAFALAFHCVDACVRPRLGGGPGLEQVPESDWFALLHASARPQPALTAEVAIALVLHVLSPGWGRLSPACRQAALRLFLTDPRDVRGDLDRLCAALPPHWMFGPAHLVVFAGAARHARAAVSEASGLCARFVATVRHRPGGLSLLGDGVAPKASPEEIAALMRNVWKYRQIAGFRKLAGLF